MDWNTVLQKIKTHDSQGIYCLYGPVSPDATELRNLADLLKKLCRTNDNNPSKEVVFLPSRSQYVSRHRHEGLFFQQRYQATYNDQGETVRQRLDSQKNSISLQELKRWRLLFGLDEIWDKPLLQLSSGEWQRYSLCEGLMAMPTILIIPDLLKGLDHQWQKKIPAILTENINNQGLILFTSDIPVDHPFVANIPLYPSSDSLGGEDIPTVPETFTELFRQYQATFLQRNRDDVLIKMDGVHIKYGENVILNDIHWSAHAGDKWNIQGPNGAGKSTLISLINADNPQGYSQPVKLFGEKYGRYSIWNRKARIAFFSSDFFQYFRSTKPMDEVLSQMLRTPYLETIQPPASLIHGLLDHFGLNEVRQQLYSIATPEHKRQLLLIASYLKSSDVLVLDEPFQDFSLARIRLNNHFLDTVQPASPQTVIFVTHRDDHKPRFPDKILKLPHRNLSR